MGIRGGISGEKASQPKRIVEIDVLRVIAIVAIVVSHLHFSIPSFKDNSTVLMAETFIATIGLTLFFFLSGCSLMLKRPSFGTASDLWTYLRKRLLRIYPLYWLALVFTMVMHSAGITSGWMTNMGAGQLVPTILGMQILLSSSFALVPFWFVSAILVYYLLFPIIVFAASRIRMSFKLSVSIVSLIIFAFLLAVTALTSEVDERLTIYYWFFIAGIIIGSEVALPSITFSRSLPWIVISAIALPFTKPDLLPPPLGDRIGSLLPAYIYDFISVALVGIIGILVMLQAAKFFRRHLWARTSRAMMWIAPNTLSIYLFSGFLVYLAARMAESVSPSLVPVMTIVIGVPLGLFIPPLVQVAVDKVVDLMFGRRRSAALANNQYIAGTHKIDHASSGTGQEDRPR